MNATLDQPQIFISTQPIFDEEEEARMAFVRGRLPWIPEQEAVTYQQRRGKIIGHQNVIVKTVIGIDSDGAPLYLCQDDYGRLITIPHGMLMTLQQLLYLPDGKPTVYHEWLIQEMQRQYEQYERLLRNPPPVFGQLTWKEKPYPIV